MIIVIIYLIWFDLPEVDINLIFYHVKGVKSMDCTSDNLPDDSDQITHGKHGTSFTIQDENSPVVTAKPPRRLQVCLNSKNII